jgi:hypothetical protein
MKTIIINATKHEVDLDVISYQQVAQLAYPDRVNTDIVYSATYTRGRGQQGYSLMRTDAVTVSEGMLFSIFLTNNA